MWTIYRHPNDYPASYVVRKFYVTHTGAVPTLDVVIADDFAGARGAVPPGCVNLGREPGDDAAIVETWV